MAQCTSMLAVAYRRLLIGDVTSCAKPPGNNPTLIPQRFLRTQLSIARRILRDLGRVEISRTSVMNSSDQDAVAHFEITKCDFVVTVLQNRIVADRNFVFGPAVLPSTA